MSEVSQVKGKGPEEAGVGRVSPTAPASKSMSTGVWRLLDGTPGFRERVERGREQLVEGDTVAMSDLRRELDLPGR